MIFSFPFSFFVFVSTLSNFTERNAEDGQVRPAGSINSARFSGGSVTRPVAAEKKNRLKKLDQSPMMVEFRGVISECFLFFALYAILTVSYTDEYADIYIYILYSAEHDEGNCQTATTQRRRRHPLPNFSSLNKLPALPPKKIPTFEIQENNSFGVR